MLAVRAELGAPYTGSGAPPSAASRPDARSRTATRPWVEYTIRLPRRVEPRRVHPAGRPGAGRRVSAESAATGQIADAGRRSLGITSLSVAGENLAAV